MLRASAGLSAHGDAVRQVMVRDVGAVKLFSRGFDFLVLSVGPVYHFAPAASLLAPYLGAQVTYMNGICAWDGMGWGGGVTGGLTFWLSKSVGVDSGVTATVFRHRNTFLGDGVYWTSGRVVTFTLGLVLALR
jgi:hypothetical protein